jgi:exonuclease III
MLKQQYITEDKSMADRESSFERKCSFCGQEEKTLIGNTDNRFICSKCIIECASILVSEKYDPSDMELSALLDDVLGGIDIKNHLKILSWNCHYGLNLKKYLTIMEYKPEVLILQECTKTDFEFIKNMWEYGNWYNDAMYSHDRELGLAILSNRCKINFTEIFNRKFRYVIPYELTWNDEKLTVFITWINPTDKNNYDEHLCDAIDYYTNKGMLNKKSIVIGDFNTFAKDDKDLKRLEEKMLPLVNCAKGTQLKFTYNYAQNSMGVDDFCFVSEDMINNFIIHINILSAWDKAQDKDHHWRGLSDHCPIIVDLQEKTNLAQTRKNKVEPDKSPSDTNFSLSLHDRLMNVC